MTDSPSQSVSQSPDQSVTRPVSQPVRRRRAHRWPILLLCLPASVAIWGGWVGLGGLTGFGVIHPLPGIAESVTVDMAVTLPVGMESYAAYALYVWLTPHMPPRARRFARWSALLALVVGAAGQVAYHLMASLGIKSAPWWVTLTVSCVPVAVVALGGSLVHLLMDESAGSSRTPSSQASQRRPSWIVRAAGDVRQAADELRVQRQSVTTQQASQDESPAEVTDPDDGQSVRRSAVTPPRPVRRVSQSPDLHLVDGQAVSQLTPTQEERVTALLAAYGDSTIPGRPAVMTRMGWTNAGLTGRLIKVARERQSVGQSHGQSGSQSVSRPDGQAAGTVALDG